MTAHERLENQLIEEAAAESIPQSAMLLFAPVDKRAFGAAIGVASALIVAGVTVLTLLRGDPWMALGLLSHFFAGYSLSWSGAIIGAAWAFVVGFIFGWLVAFTRNLTLAMSLFLMRSRVELDETSDFLDHI
jgi:hypothetical protein